MKWPEWILYNSYTDQNKYNVTVIPIKINIIWKLNTDQNKYYITYIYTDQNK